MEYTELKVWKKTRKLVNDLYDITKKLPKDKVYGLTSQIRRSTVSTPSNIVEGLVAKELLPTAYIFSISTDVYYMN
jgi:four helix bundle protein